MGVVTMYKLSYIELVYNIDIADRGMYKLSYIADGGSHHV